MDRDLILLLIGGALTLVGTAFAKMLDWLVASRNRFIPERLPVYGREMGLALHVEEIAKDLLARVDRGEPISADRLALLRSVTSDLTREGGMIAIIGTATVAERAGWNIPACAQEVLELLDLPQPESSAVHAALNRLSLFVLEFRTLAQQELRLQPGGTLKRERDFMAGLGMPYPDSGVELTQDRPRWWLPTAFAAVALVGALAGFVLGQLL